jgi:hypothetical protein
VSEKTKRHLFAVAVSGIFPASAVLAILLGEITSQLWFLFFAVVGIMLLGVVVAQYGKIMAYQVFGSAFVLALTDEGVSFCPLAQLHGLK